MKTNPSAVAAMFSMRMMVALCAAAVLCGAQGVLAAEIVKQIDGDGHVTITNNPGPDASMILRYAALSGWSGEQPGPQQTASANWQSAVERALSNMARISSARATTIDANEAVRRSRQEPDDAGDGTRLPSAFVIVDDDAVAAPGARISGAGKTLAERIYGTEKPAISIALTCILALGGCLAIFAMLGILGYIRPGNPRLTAFLARSRGHALVV